ncbi:uracil-DNA glycosylase family protein [Arachidicoccus terrestris]|uniref:uracil-DNA glycosylase family protein n=1 Tax=Arachidicoccus terrestris TaxID=2875539 RepID=UPI001CC39C70|nr:uracil-DNA glycosylase family protein [Arachidicoccus terrestris]UAY54610.1 hypothetical protein K9M52_14295 [Arachidicoccus terrestris]
MQIETHPHAPFIPDTLKVLIMGSFPGRSTTLSDDPGNQWFYSARRNQFWKILEKVFEKPLPDQETKSAVLSLHGIGIADILLQITRLKDSNADQDLEIVTYNDKAIGDILKRYPNVCVCFTSRFVEKHFKSLFPAHQHSILLPSPSPRYARLNLDQKAALYKQILFFGVEK